MNINKLFSSARKWVKFRLGVDADGNGTLPDASDAVRWCLLGAVHKCYPGYGRDTQAAIIRLRDVISGLYPEFVDRYSDAGTIVNFNNDAKTDFRKIKRVIKAANV